MIRTALLSALVAAGIVLPAAAQDPGRLGALGVLEPAGKASAFVILYSDKGGWSAADEAAARALAGEGALVAKVDTDAYLARMDATDEPCHWPEGDAEAYSHRLQRDRGGADYMTPILAGRGIGATLAEVALAEAPPVTIAGALSLDPVPSIVSKKPMCADIAPRATPEGFVYGPTAKLEGFWSVAFTAAASRAARDHVAGLRAKGLPVDLVETDGAGHPLAQLLKPRLARAQAARAGAARLDLVELPSAKPSPVMAVVLSGDGGWRDLDKTIAEHLQQAGVPVVGWDMLRYFWHRKSPDEAAAALADVIDTYAARWHAGRVALVGYSFGAGVLPFLYNRLPEAARRRVVLMSLLGFEDHADFEASPTGWLGAPPSAQALPVKPEMARVPSTLVQCFYGEEETDSACPSYGPVGVQLIRTKGGHHFDGDYAGLARRILERLKTD